MTIDQLHNVPTYETTGAVLRSILKLGMASHSSERMLSKSPLKRCSSRKYCVSIKAKVAMGRSAKRLTKGR